MGENSKVQAVGFDLDGVIIDHTANKIAVAGKFGYDISAVNTPSDIMRQKIPGEVRAKIQQVLYDDPRFALEAPMMPGAEEGLLFIHNSGFPYYLISRRKRPDLAIQWLKNRGFWPAIFGPQNAFFVSWEDNKAEKASALGISIYVDDEPTVLSGLHTVPHRFLFDPHGAYTEYSEAYARVHSWDEFTGAVKKFLA